MSRPRTERERAYHREYMRKRRLEAKLGKIIQNPCLVCGAERPRSRFFYCSDGCRKRAAGQRYWIKFRLTLVERGRKYRTEHPDIAREASARWRRQHPDYYKASCPECGGQMNRGAKRCDPCRLGFERPCRDNRNCSVERSHKHCSSCWEPIYRRWDELCQVCEAERKRLRLTVLDFKALNNTQEAA